ncbi:hypothetical protein CK203_025132 [Vitis vinifera]|uniref:Uncharacterized protein n=1 Tax=Vitis vinifera TaxID=29760 RepID=A0A438JF47_VITVI|nr:hypothetical protein CK203_025132 [Vitis vinifera]
MYLFWGFLPPPTLQTVFLASFDYFFSILILHVPKEVFFYLSGGATLRFEAVSLSSGATPQSAAVLGLSLIQISFILQIRYEDHLITQEADIPEPTGLGSITYIGQIASLKEEFLTVMPLTSDVRAQQTQLDKFFMVLTLIGLRPDLEPVRDQILVVHQFRPWMISRGGRSGTRGRGQRPHCTYCNKLGHTRDRCYQLHGRPPHTTHVAQSSDSPLPQPPSSSASQASVASIAQPGSFFLYYYYSALPTVTLANDSQLWLKDRSTGKTIGIGRES